MISRQNEKYAASYPDVSLDVRAKVWYLAVHHQSLAFRARLCNAKNEAPEEEAEKCGNYYTRNVPSKNLYFVHNNKNG